MALQTKGKLLSYVNMQLKTLFRIPKIAKYLQERCYKELRCGHIKLINIVIGAYKKLLCMCKEQISHVKSSVTLPIHGCPQVLLVVTLVGDGTYIILRSSSIKYVC